MTRPMRKAITPHKVRKIVDKALGAGAAAARKSVRDQLSKLEPKPSAAKIDAVSEGAVRMPAILGAKRTAEEIEQTALAALAVIRERPRIIPEQIAAELKVRSADLTLPLRLLVDPVPPTKARAKVSGRKRYSRYEAL